MIRMPLFVLLLWPLACVGGGSSSPGAAAGARASAPNAPRWAQDGDQTRDDGTLFVCEGSGATEDDALAAARAVCSAKICGLCGVEVEAVVETRETLTSVEVQRKVVETCKRVRKSDDEVRYKQSACGPGGCTSWLQVFFGKEAEARECRAYAEGDFADPAACERLIDEFRHTPGLAAESFFRRAELLSQAILACADIDVRPTPRLQALDEVFWQGVIAPALVPWTPEPVPERGPLSERVQTYLAILAQRAWRSYEDDIYTPVNRQLLKETKVFVDRLAMVRDSMRAYHSITAMLEALARTRYAAEPDSAPLIRAMQELVPTGRHERASLTLWVAGVLAGAPRDWPRVKAYLMESFSHDGLSYEAASAMARLFVADRRISREEWQYVKDHGPWSTCFEIMLAVEDHGGEQILFDHFSEAVTALLADPKRAKQVPRLLSALSPDQLLRIESQLPERVRQMITWERLDRALGRMPPRGGSPKADNIRDRLATRMHRQLQQDLDNKPVALCNKLSRRLGLLEEEGVSTRTYESALCRCLEENGRRRVGNLDELYLRVLEWGSQCVGSGRTS